MSTAKQNLVQDGGGNTTADQHLPEPPMNDWYEERSSAAEHMTVVRPYPFLTLARFRADRTRLSVNHEAAGASPAALQLLMPGVLKPPARKRPADED